MKKTLQLIFSLFTAFILAGCVQTTNDPAVGKTDFAKLVRWSESEPMKDDGNMKEPETPAQFEKFIDTVLDNYTQAGKALDLRHTEVKALRDRTIKYINTYLREYMKLYVLSYSCNTEAPDCKSLEPRVEIFKLEAKKMETEVEELEKEYEKLGKQFDVNVNSAILK